MKRGIREQMFTGLTINSAMMVKLNYGLELLLILLTSTCVELVYFGYHCNSASMKAPCPNCRVGYEPRIRFGKVEELSMADIECVSCSKDSYKSDNTWNMCRKCSICSTNEVEMISCSATVNRKCECKVGYYKDTKTGRCQPLQMDFYGSYYEQKCATCPKKRCIDCPADMEPVIPCGKVDHLKKVNFTCRPCPDGTHKRDVSWQSCTKVIGYIQDVDNTYMKYGKESMVAISMMMTAIVIMIMLVIFVLVYWRHRAKHRIRTDKEVLWIEESSGFQQRKGHVDESMKRLGVTMDTASPVFNSNIPAQYHWVLDMSEKKKIYEVKMEIAQCKKDIQDRYNIKLNDPEKMGAFVTKRLQDNLKLEELEEIDVNLIEIKNEEVPSSESKSICMVIESTLDTSGLSSHFCEKLSNRYSTEAMTFTKTLSKKIEEKAKFDKIQMEIFEYQKWEFTDSNFLMTTKVKKKNKKYWSTSEKCKAIEYFNASFEEMLNGITVEVRPLQPTVLLKDKYKFNFKLSFTNEDSTNAVNNFINNCTKEKKALFF